MRPHHRSSLIAVLLFSSLMWGATVAVHHHIGIDTDHCEICLLPHAAAIQQQLVVVVPAQVQIPAAIGALSRPTLAAISHYHSRAPPTL